MKKRNLIIASFFCMIALSSFVSAYSYSSQFSIQGFLDSLDPETVYLVGIFLVLFVVSNFALSRLFRDNRMAAAVAAFAVSFVATYGIYLSGIDFGSMIENLGITQGMINTIIIIAIIGVFLYMGFRFHSWGVACFLLGVIFVLVAFFVYNKLIPGVAAFVCFLLSIIFFNMERKKRIISHRAFGI